MRYAILACLSFLCLSLSFIFGFYIRSMANKVKQLQQNYAKRDKKKREDDEPKSVFIDPDDVASRVQYEHREMLKKLNPEE